jgi:hypothetical protein
MKKSNMKPGDVLFATVYAIPTSGNELLLAAASMKTLKDGFERIGGLMADFDPAKAVKIVLTAEPKNTDEPQRTP